MPDNKGQSLIGIIIVLVAVGLISGGLYLYLSNQIPEISKVSEKETTEPEGTISPTEEETIEEITPQSEETTSTLPPPGTLTVQKCADGTSYGQCSSNKPKYCEGGNLIDKASLCGCAGGYKISDNKCEKISISQPNVVIPVIFALNKTYADKFPNWKQEADEVMSQISFVFSKTTLVKEFKINKYIIYDDSEYANLSDPGLSPSPGKYSEYYQEGSITYILLVSKDGISSQEFDKLYGSGAYINASRPVFIEGKTYQAALIGNTEALNVLQDEKRSLFIQQSAHEMGHTFGLASPEFYLFEYSDCTGVNPKFPDYSVVKDSYYKNDPMANTMLRDINTMQFSELNSAIINRNLDVNYATFEDIRKNWFAKITKVYVADSSGNPISGATIKIFPIRKGCIYCFTRCKGVEYGQGVLENPDPEQTLLTDKNGYAVYNRIIPGWAEVETKETPVQAKTIKVYYQGKSAAATVNFVDLQKSYVLDNSNEHIISIILE